MSDPAVSRLSSSPGCPLSEPEAGMTLIVLIAVLAMISVGLAAFSTSMVRVWDRKYQEEEARTLQMIAGGISTYLHQNKAFPTSLTNLTPDYVALSSAGITRNARGFRRYFAVHPAMGGFQNSVGLSVGELGHVRYLLISNLSQDAAPVITTPAEFDAWWTTDESLTPNLKLHRENAGHLFYSLSIIPKGNGASFSIHNQRTDSNGGLLPTHGRFHLMGTEIGLDEDNIYTGPEVFFGLMTSSVYWFDPNCPVTKRWNPLNPPC